MPSSLSIGIIGGAYGGTLGRAAKWDDLAEGSLTLSYGQKKKKKERVKKLKNTTAKHLVTEERELNSNKKPKHCSIIYSYMQPTAQWNGR